MRGSFPWRAGGPNAIFTTWAAGLDKVSLPVKFYDFASQRTMQIGAIEKEVDGNYPGFTATRDCQRIAWAQIDRMDTDLMMIENFQ